MKGAGVVRMENPGTFPSECHVHGASAPTLEQISLLRPKRIGEVGAYKGFTTLEILRSAPWLESIHIFDFQDRIDAILASVPPEFLGKVVGHGNGRETFSSYNDSLFALLRDGQREIYDYVILDGAHTFPFDALAFFLIDKLLHPGGHIDFDDYGWSLEKSPTQNPEVFPMTKVLYSDLQIEMRAVKEIVETLVLPSGRYEEVVPKRLYRKARRDNG